MKRTFVVIALFVLGACSFDRPSPEKSFYAFETVVTEQSLPTTPRRLLAVPRASVAPPFGARALQYRIAANRYEPSYYHNWADDPGALIAAAARVMVAGDGAFAVLAPNADASGAAVLDLYVSALYVDVTVAPTVVLGLQATVRDETSQVLLTREFQRSERSATAEAGDAVAALNTVLEGILDELAAELSRVER